MNTGLQIVLSGALTFGIPLVIAVHEFFVLRRPQGDGWGGDDPKPPTPKPYPNLTPNKLPACLIPNLPPIPARQRTPEKVS